MCAIEAAEHGVRSLVLEAGPKPGRKLLAAGSGRCNLAHAGSIESYLEGFDTKAARFLKPSAYLLSPEKTMDFFESLHVPLKTERGFRVFPQSDKSLDVLEALLKKTVNTGVIFKTSGKVLSVKKQSQLFEIKTVSDLYISKTVIIATGGLSMKRTGSTGDGYRIAKTFGHTVTGLRASLVPLITKESWPGEVSGRSLKNVKLKAVVDSKRFERFGEMSFTDNGIGGPITLEMSRFVTDKLLDNSEPVRFEIDLKPALDEKKLDARLMREIESSPSRDFIGILHTLVPSWFADVLVRHFGFNPAVKVSHITKNDRFRLRNLLKAIPLTVLKTAPIEQALITRGGISLSEIDPHTMMSKLSPGLYFAGEIIDVDGDCGGYNLQMCWSTGKLAGKSAAESLKHSV